MSEGYTLTSQTVAAITGASSGIGRATAVALARRGVRLALFSRTEAALVAAEEEARKAGAADVLARTCDVRVEAQVTRAFGSNLERFGRCDILINSAGLSLNGEVDGYECEDWHTVIETNLTGTFLACRAVLPAMKKQGGGQIINISSGAGRNGIRGMAAYCASKFGVIGFTESLSHEVRGDHIRVSALLPGSVATSFTRTAERSTETEATGGEVEIGYALTAEEVAAVIVSMLEQPPQAWMSEVVLRPLNLNLKRT